MINLGRDGDDTHGRSTIDTHKLYYAGSSSIHLSQHQSMFHTIIYEQMMFMLMKCECRNARQTPGVLQPSPLKKNLVPRFGAKDFQGEEKQCHAFPNLNDSIRTSEKLSWTKSFF